jgi:hypothetical protein
MPAAGMIRLSSFSFFVLRSILTCIFRLANAENLGGIPLINFCKFEQNLCMAANSKSAKYYASHPEARDKKKKYDTVLNRRKAQIKKRVESNRKRADAKKNGMDVRGKDYDHSVNRFVATATNRGRRGEGGR